MVKMSQHVTIRTARKEDAADLARIYAYYVNKTAITFEYQAPDASEMDRRRKTILAQYPYLMAEKTVLSSAMPMLMSFTDGKPTPGLSKRQFTSIKMLASRESDVSFTKHWNGP